MLALNLFLWLTMCLFQVAIFEVDALAIKAIKA